MAVSGAKSVVLDLFRAAFWEEDPTAVSRLVHTDVMVHSPDVGRGIAYFDGALRSMVRPSPRSSHAADDGMPAPTLLLQDDDLVGTAWYLPQPDDEHDGESFDFFLFTVARVRDGRIAEFWPSANLAHPARATWASYGDGLPRPSGPSSSDRAANAALAVDFYRRVFDGEDAELASSFVTADYWQHASHYPPGRDGLLGLLRVIFPNGPRPVPETMTQPQEIVLSEGDIVLTGGPVHHSDPRDPGRTYPFYVFTAYAVRDGLLSEHWSGVNRNAPLHPVDPS